MYGEAKVRLATEVDTSPITSARNEFASLRNTVRSSESTFNSASRTFASTSKSLDNITRSSRNANTAFQTTADIGERVGDRLLNTTNSYDRLVELTDNLAIKNSSLGKSLNQVEGALFPVARAYDRIEERATPVQKTFELIQITNKNLTKTLNTTAQSVSSLGNALEKTGPAGELTAEALQAISGQLKDISWLVFAVGKLEDFRDILQGTTSALRTMSNAIGAGTGATVDFAQGANEARQKIGGLGEQVMALAGVGAMLGRGWFKVFGEIVTGAVEAKMAMDALSGAAHGIVQIQRHFNGLYDSMRLLQGMGLDTTILSLRDSIGAFGEGLILNFGLTNEILDLAIGKFAQLEQSLQFVRTISAGAELNIDQLGKKVQAFVDGPMGNAISAIETTTALYNTLSAGIGTTNLDEAFQFIEVAGKLAAATGSSLDTVSQALIFAGNTFEEEFGRVGALLKRTVDQGQLTINTLVNNLGRVSATATAVGADIENTFAAIAAASQKLGDQSNIAVNALLNSLLNIGAEGQVILDKYGISLNKATIENEGLVTALNNAFKAMGQNTQELRKVIPETLAFSAALAIVQNDSQAAKDALASFADAGIEDIEQLFEESQKTIVERLGTIQNQFTGVLEKAGQSFRESGLVDQLIKPVEDFAEAMTNLPEPVFTFIGAITTMNLAIQKTISIIGSLIGVIFSLGAAIFWIVAPLRLGAMITGFQTAFLLADKGATAAAKAFEGLKGALNGLIFGSKAYTTAELTKATAIKASNVALQEQKGVKSIGLVMDKLSLKMMTKSTLARVNETIAQKAQTKLKMNFTGVVGAETLATIANTKATTGDTVARTANAAAIKAQTIDMIAKIKVFAISLKQDIALNFAGLATAVGKVVGWFKLLIPLLGKGLIIFGKVAAVIFAVVGALSLLLDGIRALTGWFNKWDDAAKNIDKIGTASADASGALTKLSKDYLKAGEEIEASTGKYASIFAKMTHFLGNIAALVMGLVKNLGTAATAVVNWGRSIASYMANLAGFGESLYTMSDAADSTAIAYNKLDKAVEGTRNWFIKSAKWWDTALFKGQVVEALDRVNVRLADMIEMHQKTAHQFKTLQPEAIKNTIEMQEKNIQTLQAALVEAKKDYDMGRITEAQYNAKTKAIEAQVETLNKLKEIQQDLLTLDLSALYDTKNLKTYKKAIELAGKAQTTQIDIAIAEIDTALSKEKDMESFYAKNLQARREYLMALRKEAAQDAIDQANLADRRATIQRNMMDGDDNYFENLIENLKNAADTQQSIYNRLEQDPLENVGNFTVAMHNSREQLQKFADETRKIVITNEQKTTNEFQKLATGRTVKTREQIQAQIAEIEAGTDKAGDAISNLQKLTITGLEDIQREAIEYDWVPEQLEKRIQEFLATTVSGYGDLNAILREAGIDAADQQLRVIEATLNAQLKTLTETQDVRFAQLVLLKKRGLATAEDLAKQELANQREVVEAGIRNLEYLIKTAGEAVNSPRYQRYLKELAELQTRLLDLEIAEAEQKIDAALKRIQDKISIALNQVEVEARQLEIITDTLEQEKQLQVAINNVLREREKFATTQLKRIEQVLVSDTARLKVQQDIRKIEAGQRQAQIEFQIKQEEFNREQIKFQFLQIDLEEQRARLRADAQVADANAELAKARARKDVTEAEINAAETAVKVANLERNTLDENFRLRREILKQAQSLSLETEKNLKTQLELAKSDGILDKILTKYDEINAKIKDMGSQIEGVTGLIDVNKDLVEFAKEIGVREAKSVNTKKWMEENALRQLDLLKLQRKLQERMLEIEHRKEQAALRMQAIEVRNNLIIAKREKMLARVRGDYEGMQLAQEQINDLTETQALLREEQAMLTERQAIERETERRRGFLEYGRRAQELISEIPASRQRQERRALREETRREQITARRNMEKILKENGMFLRKDRKEFFKELDKTTIEANKTETEEFGKLLGINLREPMAKGLARIEATLPDGSTFTWGDLGDSLNESNKIMNENYQKIDEALAESIDSPRNMMEVVQGVTSDWKNTNKEILDGWDQTLTRLENAMGITPGTTSARAEEQAGENGTPKIEDRIRTEKLIAQEMAKSADQQAQNLKAMTEHMDNYDMFGITGPSAGITESAAGKQFKQLLDAYKSGEVSTQEFRDRSIQLRQEALAEAKKLDPIFTMAAERMELNTQVIAANADQRMAAANLQTADAISKAIGGSLVSVVEQGKQANQNAENLRKQQAEEEKRKREMLAAQERARQQQHQEAQQQRQKVEKTTETTTKNLTKVVTFNTGELERMRKENKTQLEELNAKAAEAQAKGNQEIMPVLKVLNEMQEKAKAGKLTREDVAKMDEVATKQMDMLAEGVEVYQEQFERALKTGTKEQWESAKELRNDLIQRGKEIGELQQRFWKLTVSQGALRNVEADRSPRRLIDIEASRRHEEEQRRIQQQESISGGAGQDRQRGSQGSDLLDGAVPITKLGQKQEEFKQAVNEQTRVQEKGNTKQTKEQEKTNKTLVKVAKLLSDQGKHMINNFEVTITAAPTDTPEKTANDTWSALVDIFNEVGRRSNFNNANIGTT